MRRTTILAVLSLAAALLAVFLSGWPNRWLERKAVYPPYAVTLVRVSTIEGALRLYEIEHGPMSKTLEANQTSESVNAIVMAYLREYGVTNGVELNANLEAIDAWNRPLIMRSRDDVSRNRGSHHLRNAPASIAVWSTGANGIDECGYGDDVLFRR